MIGDDGQAVAHGRIAELDVVLRVQRGGEAADHQRVRIDLAVRGRHRANGGGAGGDATNAGAGERHRAGSRADVGFNGEAAGIADPDIAGGGDEAVQRSEVVGRVRQVDAGRGRSMTSVATVMASGLADFALVEIQGERAEPGRCGSAVHNFFINGLSGFNSCDRGGHGAGLFPFSCAA